MPLELFPYDPISERKQGLLVTSLIGRDLLEKILFLAKLTKETSDVGIRKKSSNFPCFGIFASINSSLNFGNCPDP